MKITIQSIACCLLLLVSSMASADMEVEIEFRLQPDGSGTNTRNQGIAAEEDEIEVWLDGDERELDASVIDTENLFTLVENTIRDFTFIEGEDIDAPYVEVMMEFSGEDREIEVSLRYASGNMPQSLVTLQEQYLDEIWD